MNRSDLVASIHTALLVGVWAGLAPTLLVRNDAGDLDLSFRPWWAVVIAAVLLVVGSYLIREPGRQLAAAGAHLFTTTPGPRLVTDGWYGTIRKPQDVGTILVAVAPAVALAEISAWVIPAIALAYVVVGTGLYEDRRLLEEFGDEFIEYRRSVPKYIPRR